MIRNLALISFLLILSAPVLSGSAIEHWTTSKGLRVYFLKAPELPMVDIRLVFDAGSARDGVKPGLAQLTNNQLFHGAADMDLETIAIRLDRVGADYGSDSLRDMAWLRLRSLSDEEMLEPALSVFLDVVSSPTFPQQDFDRAIKQTLQSIKADEQSPSAIASKAFYQQIYGDHPYASPVKGTLKSVADIQRKDLKAFHERYYVASNAVLVIVGDQTRKHAEQIADRFDAVMQKGEVAEALPPVPEPGKAETITIPFPSEQAHIFIGQPGMLRGDDDYFPLYLGNHVLGGSGFTSRLVKEVRSDRGLAYSVYSYFMPMREKGPFISGLQTRGDQADQAVKLVLENIREFRANGPSAEELKATKRNVTGGFPLRIASNSSLVEYLAVIGFYDLPLDYLDQFNRQVEAITKEQIIDAWQRRVDTSRMVTIVVGGQNGAEKTARLD
jgi:zinc protease